MMHFRDLLMITYLLKDNLVKSMLEIV